MNGRFLKIENMNYEVFKKIELDLLTKRKEEDLNTIYGGKNKTVYNKKIGKGNMKVKQKKN